MHEQRKDDVYAGEQEDERQEKANNVCGIVLIHAEEVSLVEHLHL